MRGRFITVEGTEGVGKTTNLAFIENHLRERGRDVEVTREPGGTRLGEELRGVLLAVRDQRVDAIAELLMIFAARAQHIHEVIEPALAAGRWVLCDRFTDATYAYQGGGRGVDRGVISTLEELVQGTLRPDHTVLLDVDVTTGMTRARGRGELDRIERETLDFFERVRAAYLDLANSQPGRFHVVDAAQPLAAVQLELGRACAGWLAEGV
ncbi:MAG: dTMP kinase [Halioglobus sp.]|nr:dTMP kinase [Halioglobus sp.]